MHENTNFEEGYTDFGIKMGKNEIENYFSNDPLNSKLSISYDLIEDDEDYYSTEYIDKNSISLKLISTYKMLNSLQSVNFN